MDMDATLDRAAEQCAGRGAQLTPLRRQVLRLVLNAEHPVGAYALLDKLRDERGVAAPPTVYRALDFLMEQGLIHKLERLNAFLPCVEAGHAHAGHDHQHQFLICKKCGTTTELTDHAVSHALEAAAARAGFKPTRMTVEVEGLCARCAA
ncbi:MAG: transcriptional repressor [Rubritepida sp.]|nr:transcriptional repressor [Rubritepida sp.]